MSVTNSPKMEKQVIDIVGLCVEVLASLAQIGYEKKGSVSIEQLIFPMKTKRKKDYEEESEDRISEQELRQLFIDKFKAKAYPDLYFSIETPTKAKYKFGEADKGTEQGEELKNIKVDEKGQSALLDMCVFKSDGKDYNRILNIEFKHGNAPLKDIAKDVLKLMHEKENGAFIFLLDNTNKGSLNNIREDKMGVLDKLSKSFSEFYNRDNSNWNGDSEKCIHLIILSLERKKNSKGPALIHQILVRERFDSLKPLITINENGEGNITTVCKASGWQIVSNKENSTNITISRKQD
ncbi:hypothetical protein MPF19_16660 [Polaribacter sp. Z014]|uniref:hypothetical protein n=1 Tax=Polaribacter sp. Z014 TaxID=2927126 RepID=UPI00201FD472|nr:hypothetical protein [Polaribacter sp. Z014]MCL7765057.1 hypothetical protein [Polaribacter sp. Z014]